MPGSSYGNVFRVTTWGESHGQGVGVVIDGCPPGVPLDEETIQKMLDRRKPGQTTASTTRKEADLARIISGVFEGKTTGTTIMVMVANKDAKSDAYLPFKDTYRPGHGDITYDAKYGFRDWRGGGRSSARETVGRVASGAVAKALLSPLGIEVDTYTMELGGVRAANIDPETAHTNPYRCPDPIAAEKIEQRVQAVRKAGDTLGGIVIVKAKGVPPGWGDPVFDKLDADLAKALMSIGAVKGIEIGAGFAAANLLGSENNDAILPDGFASNHAGGILAGISNGDDITVRVAVKPIPSIAKEQQSVDRNGKPVTLSIKGRHDISAIPRINIVCEAMVWLTLADHYLRQKAIS